MNIIDRFHVWRRKLRWNKQYRSGRWETLRNDTENIRYQQIIADIKTFGKKYPSILDLGSGEGVLNEKLQPEDYSYFLGIDFSTVSIKKASEKKFPKSKFIVADLHNYKPDQNFDVIIFNEAFYYIHASEKENVLFRIINSLNSNGIIITSMYREGGGSWGYFDRDPLKKLNFTTVRTPIDKTYWKIGVYKKV